MRPRIRVDLQRDGAASPEPGSWRRELLLVLVFVGGATSLGIEFAAARLLAPFFGQSLFIWGILIGLILIYLTVGYYVGGRVADRRPDPTLLYQITAAAGLATGLIPLVSRPILLLSQTGFSQLSLGLVLGTLLAVVVLFAVPVILLGMVSPFAIRLRIKDVQTAGNAAGAVYALSTLGSIVGTFVPVFWLIPTYGTRPTLYILAVLTYEVAWPFFAFHYLLIRLRRAPEAQLVVRVAATEVFPNCPRYIHEYRLVARSRFVPKSECETPVPKWKQSEWAHDVLPEGDPAADPSREVIAQG